MRSGLCCSTRGDVLSQFAEQGLLERVETHDKTSRVRGVSWD